MEKETALKILRELHSKALFSERTALETFIPELKESDDERIRKEILDYLVSRGFRNDWIAWLEKQGKKSNIPQDTEDDLRRQSTIQVLEYARSLDAYNQYGKESINKDIAWLEKQGKQSYWKPSEEQMQTLHAQLNEGAVTYTEDKRVLSTLYEDLMKIMTIVKDYIGEENVWNSAYDFRPEHMKRCLCYDKYMGGVYCYVYDDISKYWCTQTTEEHDPGGDNHICDYADYRVTAWMSLPRTPFYYEKQGEQMSDPRYSILDKLIDADDTLPNV